MNIVTAQSSPSVPCFFLVKFILNTPLAVLVISTGRESNFHTYEEIKYSVSF